MTDVGVRELKQQLSEYLDRAAGGELVRITHRGRPKAVLGPLPGPERIDEGIASGLDHPRLGRGLGDVRRARSRGSVQDVLTEDRGG